MFGSHLSIAGGMHNALLEAEKLEFDWVQVFANNRSFTNGETDLSDAHADSCSPITGWCVLTRRYGADVRRPTEEQLRSSVDELYNKRPDDHEHASITMRFGVDDGSMYVLEAGMSKLVTFSRFADHDFEEQVGENRAESADEATLIQLLSLLSKGDLVTIRKLVPACGW